MWHTPVEHHPIAYAQAIVVMLDTAEQAHSAHNPESRVDDIITGSITVDTKKHGSQKRLETRSEEKAAEHTSPRNDGNTSPPSALPASPVSPALSQNKVAAMKNVGSMIFRTFLQRTESDPISKQVSYILDKAKAAATNPAPTTSKKASSKSRLSSYAEKAKMQTSHERASGVSKAKKTLNYHSIMNSMSNTPRMRINEQKTAKEILWASAAGSRSSARGQSGLKRKDSR